MSDFFNGINILYKKKDYFDLYGGSFISMLIVLSTFFVFFSYYWILSNRTDIKKDWDRMKCHPGVIPFAGFINAPEGVNKVDYTKENFAGCFFNILKNVTKVFTAPIQIIYKVLLNFFISVSNSLNNIRKIQAFFLGLLGFQYDNTLNSTYGSLIPLKLVMNKISIIFKKIGGILKLFYFTIVKIFHLTKSMFLFILTIAANILKIALAVLLVLWIFAFLFPPVAITAKIGTVIWITCLILLIMATSVINAIYKELDINVLSLIGLRNNDIFEKNET